MEIHDVWIAVLIGIECMRCGYEASRTVELPEFEFPGRFVISVLLVILLGCAWIHINQ